MLQAWPFKDEAPWEMYSEEHVWDCPSYGVCVRVREGVGKRVSSSYRGKPDHKSSQESSVNVSKASAGLEVTLMDRVIKRCKPSKQVCLC